LARYFPQRAHDRDAEERQRRQGRTDDHVLRFVTSVGAEHGCLPQLRGTTAERRQRRQDCQRDSPVLHAGGLCLFYSPHGNDKVL